MTRNRTQLSEHRALAKAGRAVSFAEQERIMARARCQRAEEMARLIRIAAAKASGMIEAILLRVAHYREPSRNVG